MALIVGISLAQIGEFSFVLSKVGLEAGLLDAGLNQLFLAVAVGTMAITPLTMRAAPRLAAWADRRVPMQRQVREQRLHARGLQPHAHSVTADLESSEEGHPA